MMSVQRHIKLSPIDAPPRCNAVTKVAISDSTITARKAKVIANMARANIDYLLVYADKEHGGNFEYLTGFIPRFEEAALVLHASGKIFLLLGNENLKLSQYARVSNTAIHIPYFSLPNQPMNNSKTLADLLADTGIQQAKKVGIAGWKLFTSKLDDNSQLFDIPHFILSAIKQTVSSSTPVVNATNLFIGSDTAARVTNNANELAHYEYGANLASNCILNALTAVDIGVTEKQLGSYLADEGQPNTVVMIAATGDRFENANLYPGDKIVQLGDKISLTTGYKGGLSSRTGYAVHHSDELPLAQRDYLERVAIPYYAAVVTWLENIRIGMSGKEMYAAIEAVLPKSQYHWSLNPGHLVADEEWLCSPIYKDSEEKIRSGMLFQIDIIPVVKGYAGVSAEDGIALADQHLRDELAAHYPDVWQRIQKRRDYLSNILNIHLSEEVLPMSNTVGYLRPFLLDKYSALQCTNEAQG
ncbi:aminopeptidase P family N-terminal domain-containing protein [Yersinia enterocolitica]|uniref:Creatinase/Prolidase N-terminal domain n=1 Tax=Yersinia enterocolitica TaxID=630 RepID=A0A9P1V438_YEREN|nr:MULTISPECIES: aminopeptidase P family protein [Yersinia]AKF38959.1 xaa-Pro aminopeptidase [Yersinia enterocolitica]ALG44461.1 xaa-Pro aminopeptidase [Yersinia enterocolitica]EKN3338805.1 aminopeptidase P family N-terminal domain-containing protein [Yersinia enterocolitica]EKN3343473.1 aminopeptidase P family N-terminal domain-containing protein [Yersinia enterocolitica]EKN3384483.1 aminopeptidase P family N-terminal domain-containing protein [Yersinia enterocolitica]